MSSNEPQRAPVGLMSLNKLKYVEINQKYSNEPK